MDIHVWNDIEATTRVDGKTVTELALKTSEEVGELAQAVLSSTHASGNSYKQKTKYDVVEEAVDVTLCAMATAIRAWPELQYEDILDVFRRKIYKWNSVVNGRSE